MTYVYTKNLHIFFIILLLNTLLLKPHLTCEKFCPIFSVVLLIFLVLHTYQLQVYIYCVTRFHNLLYLNRLKLKTKVIILSLSLHHHMCVCVKMCMKQQSFVLHVKVWNEKFLHLFIAFMNFFFTSLSLIFEIRMTWQSQVFTVKHNKTNYKFWSFFTLLIHGTLPRNEWLFIWFFDCLQLFTERK